MTLRMFSSQAPTRWVPAALAMRWSRGAQTRHSEAQRHVRTLLGEEEYALLLRSGSVWTLPEATEAALELAARIAGDELSRA